LDIVVKSLADLSDTERRACHNLNLRGGGYMQKDLKDFGDRSDCFAVMGWEGKTLVGWCLLLNLRIPELYVTANAKRKSKYMAQVYVRARYRGRGIGHSLMQEALKLDDRPHVYPHDERAAAFFARYRVSCTQRYVKNLNQARKEKPVAS